MTKEESLEILHNVLQIIESMNDDEFFNYMKKHSKTFKKLAEKQTSDDKKCERCAYKTFKNCGLIEGVTCKNFEFFKEI